MTKLIIAEKPSVATDIARVLGGMKKKGDYYEGGDWIVANALGHLLELSCPEKYEVKRGKWTFGHLPVLPPTFDLKPIAKSGEKLKSLARLLRRPDVDTVINACDAGREGELIFRYIMQAAKSKKKIERLWLQSMTPGAIKEAFSHLRSDAEMTKLADAARSRSEADWLVGINGTRAMTAFNSLDGGFFLTTVGRVQTPTLAIVVRRENEIKNFKTQPYWEVEAEFSLDDATYTGRWFDPNFSRDAKKPELKAERIFDNAKISDHFAIIPTLQPPHGALTEEEKKIYDLVLRRFIAVFYPAAEYDVTTRITTVGQDAFKTEGKVLVLPGWMEVYGKTQLGSEAMLCPLNGKSAVKTISVKREDCQTKPPARYTEATLLSAMEGAGRLVKDDELRDAMAEKGLGTPATRAAIIENLIEQRYIRREGRELIPSAKAKQLFTLIEGLGIGVLSNPALTGEWEYKLSQIEKGKLQRSDFMREIREMTTHIVAAAKQYEGDTVPVENPAHLKHRCPKCGGEIVENYRRYACTNPMCDFSLPKHPGGRTFEPEEVEKLLADGSVGPLTGFVSKMGRPFSAVLKLTPEKKLEFDFGQEEKPEEKEDISGLPVVGTCPKCGGRVVQGATSFFCEHTLGKQTCDFRCGRVILQQPISPEECKKILTEGKSSLLPGFVSNRTHRKFKAYLVLDKKTGKIGFEFEPREASREKTERKKTERKARTSKKA